MARWRAVVRDGSNNLIRWVLLDEFFYPAEPQPYIDPAVSSETVYPWGGVQEMLIHGEGVVWADVDERVSLELTIRFLNDPSTILYYADGATVYRGFAFYHLWIQLLG